MRISILLGASGIFYFWDGLLVRLVFFVWNSLSLMDYAKMSPNLFYNLQNGIEYLGEFLNFNKVLIFVCIGPIVAALLLDLPKLLKARFKSAAIDFQQVEFVAISIICLVGLLIPVWEGGDHFGLSRFYQPLWPVWILPGSLLIKKVVPHFSYAIQPWERSIALTLLVIFMITPKANWFNKLHYNYLRHEFDLASYGEKAGNLLNQIFIADQPSVGVITAGGIGVTYHGKIFDLMGLNNKEMALAPGDRIGMKNHASSNSAVFWKQQPDLILPIAPLVSSSEYFWASWSKSEFCWHTQRLNGLLNNGYFQKNTPLAYCVFTINKLPYTSAIASLRISISPHFNSPLSLI